MQFAGVRSASYAIELIHQMLSNLFRCAVLAGVVAEPSRMSRSIDIRLTDEHHRGPSVYLSGANNFDDFGQIFLSTKSQKCGPFSHKYRDCRKDIKMQDFPHDCGTVDTNFQHSSL